MKISLEGYKYKVASI